MAARAYARSHAALEHFKSVNPFKPRFKNNNLQIHLSDNKEKYPCDRVDPLFAAALVLFP
jgi:hypothetical protein